MAEKINTINYLNNINNNKKFFKEIVPLRLIPMNEKKQILKCIRTTTKFGPKIMLELESCVIFLPERYTNLPDEVVNDLSSGDFYFQKVFNGNSFDIIFVSF